MIRSPLVAVATFLLAFTAFSAPALAIDVVVTPPANFNRVLFEGEPTITVGVTLNQQPKNVVTVGIRTRANQVYVSPSSLQFTPNTWNIPQYVKVRAISDSISEGEHTDAILFETSSPNDPEFVSEYEVFVVTITDEVPRQPRVRVLIRDDGGLREITAERPLRYVEGTSIPVYLEMLEAPNVPVVISPVSSSVQTFVPTRFDTTNWSDPRPVYLRTAHDLLMAPGGSSVGAGTGLLGTLERTSIPSYLAGQIPTIVYESTDLPQVQISPLPATAVEGTNLSASVTLSRRPVEPVTVVVRNVHSPAISTGARVLTFSPSNWMVPQQVTVEIPPDDDAVQSGRSITLSAYMYIPTIHGYRTSMTTPSLIVADNDMASIVITRTNGSNVTSESGRFDRVFISLSSQPSATVTLDLTRRSQVGARAASGRTARLTFTRDNWNVPQEVLIWAVDDTVKEASTHYGYLKWTASSSDIVYTGRSASTRVTVRDND